MKITSFLRRRLRRRLSTRLARLFVKSASVPALMVGKGEVTADQALAPSGIGKRKILVTERFSGEARVDDVRWRRTEAGAAPLILETDNLELSYFNEQAAQDCHRHIRATEIYTVQSGEMKIRISGEMYILGAGDTIVVMPGALHQVLPAPESPFLCQVIAVNVSVGDKTIIRIR